MSKEITYDDGTQETVFTAEDIEAKAKEESEKISAEKDAEIERLTKLNSEKTENFKKYNQMTDEEKKAYDANTTELLKRMDKQAEELEETRTKLSEKEKREQEGAKTNALSSFHLGDADTKTKLEEKYALLSGMPETTEEEINARAVEAAKLAGIQVDPRNPLYVHFTGEAPKFKEKGKDFVETPKGQEAAQLVREASGLPDPKEK